MDENSGPELNSQTFDKYTLLKNIRALHSDFTLCGEPRNELLNVSDESLLYIISLLKNEKPIAPNLSIVQWHELIDILGPHWILPLLFWQINHVPPDERPPKAILNILRTRSLESIGRTVIAERQIKDILDAFAKENINIIVLKGWALAKTIYPRHDIRTGSDIDLFVLPDDVIHSRNVLENLGYKCFIKYFDISRNLFCEEEFRYIYLSKDFLQVEIHWSLSELPLLRGHDDNQFIYRSITVNSPKLVFQTLSPVDSLIHSAMHLGLKHNRDVRLSWIIDISLLCKSLSRDEWILLQKRSVEYGARLSLETSIIMAQLWTGLQIPPEFNDFRKWPEPTEKEVSTFLYATKKRNKTISRLRLYWPRSTTISEKINILRFFIFPPRELIYENYKITKNLDLMLFYCKRWLKLIINI